MSSARQGAAHKFLGFRDSNPRMPTPAEEAICWNSHEARANPVGPLPTIEHIDKLTRIRAALEAADDYAGRIFNEKGQRLDR